MNEKKFGAQVAFLRKEAGLTQDELAQKLHVSPQAVSKWENGHSLPETALLPALARILNIGIDDLFNSGSLVILAAHFGDGIESVDVTKRLNRLTENEGLRITAAAPLLGAPAANERASYLTVKYKTQNGVCYAAVLEGGDLDLTSADAPAVLPADGLVITAGRYGTRRHNYDVMPKIEHYKVFNPSAYHANHETFPSDPANDGTEYLTLVYLNGNGIKMATCAENESLCYHHNRTELIRQQKKEEYFIPDVPKLPFFGSGMECSWAAALTAALQAMGVKITYEEVMGVSGACYRLAFHSPVWDYSSVDGLVAYDYALPGYTAFGYTPVMHGRIEKEERPEHRARITREIRGHMPVLGINLRVAPEWGVICGYAKDGQEFYCRTKYDQPTIENDPEFIKGHPKFNKENLGPYDYLHMDNWPFLLCYFSDKRNPPPPKENLINSLKVFIDCAAKEKEGHYSMGFKAYEVWSADLRDEDFYETCDDEQMARRLNVNQFCTLALLDARKSAHAYLKSSAGLIEGNSLSPVTDCFGKITAIIEGVHISLDSKKALDGIEARQFWTKEKRYAQADAWDEAARLEKEAFGLVEKLLAGVDTALR